MQFPLLPLVKVKHPVGGLKPDEVKEKAGIIIDKIISALTNPDTPEELYRENVVGKHEPPRTDFTRPRYQKNEAFPHANEPLEIINDFYYDNGLTDGFPIIPPTTQRVDAMLAYTDLPRNHVLADIPPGLGEASVEKIAVNAVMAGCYPEFLPIIITAIKAICPKEFNLSAIQTTTHLAAPLIIVNGPLAKELAINSGTNVFGQGWIANSTIGRALRLILINIGGGYPGLTDKATFGHPGKYSYCIAENEPENPWEPLHVERGFDPSVSTVTVIGAEAPHNISDHESNTAEGLLTSIANTMSIVGSNNVRLGGQPLLVLGLEHATTIAKGGYKKESIKDFLFKNVQIPLKACSDKKLERIKETRPNCFLYDVSEFPLVDDPSQIMIIVAGGEGKHSLFIPTFGQTIAQTMPVVDKNERPVMSVKDFVSS